VVLELGFPTPTSFLQSTEARILIFPVTEEDLGICPELLSGLARSSFPIDSVHDTDFVDVCDVRGGLRLPDLAPGPHAYLVEVRDASSRILQGCAVGEVFDGAGTIPVSLQPTAEYFDSPPATGTVDSYCGGGAD
jgi:hypothetical protein